MTRTKIILLSLLMSLTVLGLVLFQLYWIRTAVHLKEDELARNVQEALMEVSKKLEKQEVVNYTIQQSNFQIIGHNNVRVLQFPAAPAAAVPPASELAPVPLDTLKKKVWVEDGRVVVELMEGRESEQINRRYETRAPAPGEVYRSRPPSPTSAREADRAAADAAAHAHENGKQWQRHASDYTAAAAAAAKELEERLYHRQQVNMLYLQQLMAEELSLKKRIDSVQIDTLLRAALRNRGIEAGFQWAVLQGPQQQLVYNSGHMQADTLNLYQAALFPNDLFRSDSYLSVYIPNQTSYLLSRMSTTLASSALLMLIVIGCFVYAVYTILRQKKLSEMKNDFINNMTHELKTPIATVSMACEALADPDLRVQPNILERYLGIIRQENRRLGQQVEKVLQIARLEKQKLNLKLEPVDVHELAEGIADIYRLQLPAGGVIRLHLQAPEASIMADRLHLTGILNNLLENAIKYSEGAPQVDVYTEATTIGSKKALLVRVADKGIGISQENQEKIFDKFYRVPTGNVHNVKGFGLGLAFVRFSAEAHGGRISVQSKPGAGSTFTVVLPLNTATDAESEHTGSRR